MHVYRFVNDCGMVDVSAEFKHWDPARVGTEDDARWDAAGAYYSSATGGRSTAPFADGRREELVEDLRVRDSFSA